MRSRFLFFSFLVGLRCTDGFVAPLQKDRILKKSSFLRDKINPNGDAKSISAAAMEQMKNIKPEDIDRMMEEMDKMNPLQKNALKAMNMDPDLMKKRMKMMRDNPSIVANAQKVMENMSPDELLTSARRAQEQLKTVPEEQIEAAVQSMKSERTSDKEVLMETGPGSSSDSQVIDAMFRVAEFMSEPPTDGGVTFAGFYALPVIQLLSGDRESDLSMSELKECWDAGSSGAARVDRLGFESVWEEVQEYFEQDIMADSRKEVKKRITNGPTKTSNAASQTIGENLNLEQLEQVNEQVKNLSTSSVVEMMENMDPEQEARVKSMGIDPKMMQQTAAMLKENPQMSEQVQKMMQSMSPEDMLKASQQAQEKMSNMSEDEVQQVLNRLKKPTDL